MGKAVTILLLQVTVPVLVLFLVIASDSRGAGLFILCTMIFLLASPLVFRLDEVQDNIGLRLAAIAVVVVSYLLLFLLIPVLIMAIVTV
jgi:hypothetical protein